MSFSLVEMLTFSNFSFIRLKRQRCPNSLNFRITQKREAAMDSIQTYNLRNVLLETRRNQEVGTSLRYVWDDAFRSLGIQRTPVAYRREASLPWRAARKLVRLT